MENNNLFPMHFEDGLPLESHPMLQSSSATGSIGSASTMGPLRDPITPPSGRSTPGFQTVMMDHDGGTLNYFGPTPPSLEVDYGLQNGSIQAMGSHNFGYHPFTDQMISPPTEYPQAAYQFDNIHYQPNPSWPWPGEGQMNLFEKHPSSRVGTQQPVLTPLAISRVEDRYYHPHIQPHERRHHHMSRAQEKTNALQRVQTNRVSKRTKRPTITTRHGYPAGNSSFRNAHLHSITIVPSAKHPCEFPECNKVFKRAEHLKRHTTSVHQESDPTWCPFCWHMFNRLDNSRGHIHLHGILNAKSRVEHHPLAADLYALEQEKARERRSRKKGSKVEEIPEEQKPVIIGPMLPKLLKLSDFPQKWMNNPPDFLKKNWPGYKKAEIMTQPAAMIQQQVMIPCQ